MPVLLLDRLVPGFENVVKMNRILPFMVMCGGLLVARYISTLPLRTAVVAAGLVCGLVAAEGIVVAPANARTRPAYYLDETEDLPGPVRALPEGELHDLPVLDLPPPVGTWAKRLWNPYTYYQTEHGQRLVWYDECPADPGGFRGRIVELCKDPARHAAGDGLGKDVVRHLRDHGIGLIVLHDLGPREADTRPLVDLFDAAFPRLPAGGQAHVWRVAPDPGPGRAAPGDR